MPELPRDEHRVVALGDEDARERMPEDVERHAIETGSLGRLLEPAARQVAVPDRHPSGGAEDEVLVVRERRCDALTAELMRELLHEDHVAPPGGGLQRSPIAVAAHLMPDTDRLATQVDVGPGEAEQFREAKAREEPADERDAVALGCCREEALHLVPVEEPSPARAGPRPLRRGQAVRRVRGEDALADGVTKDQVDRRPVVVDRVRRVPGLAEMPDPADELVGREAAQLSRGERR